LCCPKSTNDNAWQSSEVLSWARHGTWQWSTLMTEWHTVGQPSVWDLGSGWKSKHRQLQAHWVPANSLLDLGPSGFGATLRWLKAYLGPRKVKNVDFTVVIYIYICVCGCLQAPMINRFDVSAIPLWTCCYFVGSNNFWKQGLRNHEPP